MKRGPQFWHEVGWMCKVAGIIVGGWALVVLFMWGMTHP